MMLSKNVKNESIIVKIIRIILMIILFPFVIIYLIREKLKRKRIEKSNEDKIRIYNMSQIDQLSGVEFENYLKALFEKMGYVVSLTKKTGDYGADLVLTKRGKQMIVQAKCYNHTVGVKAVQEVISARVHYKIKDAMVITNNYFSREAENLAVESGVTLADRVVLEKMIKDFDIRIDKMTSSFSCLTEESKTEMTQKYNYWI